MNHRAILWAFIALAFAIIPSVFAQAPTVFSTLPAANLTEADGSIIFNGTCANSGVAENVVGRRVPGGFDATLYTTGCGNFNIRSRIAADEEGWYYWITQSGSLRAHLSGASNSTEGRGTIVPDTTRLALGAETPTAVAETRFFWAEEEGFEFSQEPILLTVAKNGSSATPTTIFNGTSGGLNRGAFIWLHALSDTDVLGLTSNGALMRFRLTTLTAPFFTSFWTQSTLYSNVQAANTGDGRLWFAQRNTAAARVEIRSIAIADIGTASTEHARLGGGSALVTAIDGDGSNVFFHNRPSGASQGALFRKARGVVASVAADQIASTPGADSLNIVGRQVIWRENYNRTMKIDADAIALSRNLNFARMMEPVQIVQNPSMNVPIIRGKETVVRVYPQLATTNVPGETRVNFWPNVILHGEDDDGNRLPGSPLNALFGSREFEFIMNPLRQNRDELALFRLPSEWTEESSVRLRAELNPSQLIAESNLSDNEQTRTVTFKHKAPIEVMIHPLSTTDGKIGDFWVGEKYFPRFQPMLDRAEAVLPTDSLIHWWPGAIVIEEYEFPLSFGPYEFSEGAGDWWKVMMKLQFRQIPFKPANLVSPLQVRSAALFIGDHPDRTLNGVAMWDTFINKTSNTVRDPVSRGQTSFNSGISGITFAHEIGHTFGRGHVNCPAGAPSGIDFFPYDPCNIADDISGNIGWDPISQRQILFNATGDLMSYAHQENRPRWPSDHTYRSLEANMDSLFRPGAGTKAADDESNKSEKGEKGDKGGIALGGKQWMVFGGWNNDGTAEILFMQPVTGNDLLEAVNFFDNAEGDRATYKVRGLNAAGNVVATVDALVQEGSEEPGLRGFTALLPENNSIVRVELVTAAAPNTPVAFRTSGAAVPTVSITAPTAGATPSGTLTVSWSGNDADRDPLFYTVQLSRDGVSNWQTLTEQTLATSINVDLSTFAGNSANCRVRVIASDGIHCATATSGRFTLPDAQPEIYTFYNAGRGRKCDHLGRIEAEAGATIIVTATALDAEDGMIRDDDIAWRITGPVTRNGTGTRYDLADLPPGIYSLRCTATTSSGQTAVDTRTVEVLPKEVPDAPLDIDLDGWPDEAAWAADRRPVTFTYTSGQRATVRMIHRNGNLYVGVSGLPKGSNSRQFFGLTFHPDSGGGTSTTANDQRFSFYLDGEITRSVGNGSGYTTQDNLFGFEARISGNDDFWAIEACIPEATLGGWNDQIVRIGVGHYHRNFSGDDTFWPANGFWNRPSTWGLVRFGEPNAPPIDDDGDGLLDAWERANWGNLNRDGLGDSDGDGQNDMAEFVAGTNPRTAASGLKFSDATVVAGAGSGVTIQWDSAAGPTYDVYGSPHPEGPYTLVQGGINSTPPRNTFTIPPPTVDLRFFRISTTPID